MTAQYRNGWNDRARSCAARTTRKSAKKMPVLTAYPSFRVIDSASPPVSPSVVAAILMIQNPSVTAGILLASGLAIPGMRGVLPLRAPANVVPGRADIGPSMLHQPVEGLALRPADDGLVSF